MVGFNLKLQCTLIFYLVIYLAILNIMENRLYDSIIQLYLTMVSIFVVATFKRISLWYNWIIAITKSLLFS
jgi:hypothetical protein